jgi:hypothetical protein
MSNAYLGEPIKTTVGVFCLGIQIKKHTIIYNGKIIDQCAGASIFILSPHNVYKKDKNK